MRKIFDPVHGFIELSELESALVDSSPFQRLRYIRQLGSAYLVYPGATHTRFEHSLGTMELATRIFDHILSIEKDTNWLENPPYARQIIRLAALLHDTGHLPFSHTAEKAVLGPLGHESWTASIIRSEELSFLWKKLSLDYPGRDIEGDLIALSVGGSKRKHLKLSSPFSPWHETLGQIISGDFFGADRMDYLLRDAKYTGVSYGLFDYHQLIEMIRILPFPSLEKLQMGIEEGGLEACEALLVSRHFMHRRVYEYESVKSYAFHLSRYIEALLGPNFKEVPLSTYLFWTDNEILAELRLSQRGLSQVDPQDALALIQRNTRFRAFFLQGVEETTLQNIFKRLPEKTFLFESLPRETKNIGSFPILRRQGDVIDSKKLLQVTIPSHTGTWCYVDPRFAPDIERELSQYM